MQLQEKEKVVFVWFKENLLDMRAVEKKSVFANHL